MNRRTRWTVTPIILRKKRFNETSPDAAARGAFNVYEIQEKCLANEYHFPKESYDKLCVVVAGLDDKQSENELIQMFSYVFDEK